jgi:hypothetical protein
MRMALPSHRVPGAEHSGGHRRRAPRGGELLRAPEGKRPPCRRGTGLLGAPARGAPSPSISPPPSWKTARSERRAGGHGRLRSGQFLISLGNISEGCSSRWREIPWPSTAASTSPAP